MKYSIWIGLSKYNKLIKVFRVMKNKNNFFYASVTLLSLEMMISSFHSGTSFYRRIKIDLFYNYVHYTHDASKYDGHWNKMIGVRRAEEPDLVKKCLRLPLFHTPIIHLTFINKIKFLNLLFFYYKFFSTSLNWENFST